MPTLVDRRTHLYKSSHFHTLLIREYLKTVHLWRESSTMKASEHAYPLAEIAFASRLRPEGDNDF
jgi:hypothetical protein